MTILKQENITKLIVQKLEETNKEVLLSNPNTESTFPCYVVQTPLCSDMLTEDAQPVRQRYSISVEQWATNKYDVLKMIDDADIKLRSLNLTKTNTLLDTLDEITKKYRIVVTYEVFYNGLYNSFESVR